LESHSTDMIREGSKHSLSLTPLPLPNSSREASDSPERVQHEPRDKVA